MYVDVNVMEKYLHLQRKLLEMRAPILYSHRVC